MLTEERHRIIRSLLMNDSVVKLQDIMDATDASESTVRRDLSQLEESGELVRIHGGAKRIFTVEYEPSVREKIGQFTDEKDRIGRYAASLVEANAFIYIDAGTTTMAMIPYIQALGITVVTNGLEIASELANRDIQTILLGGQVKPKTYAMIGSDTQKQLKQYRFSKAFIGTNGIDSQYGFTTPDIEEANIKQMAINQANQAYILSDSSKFEKVSFCKIVELDDATIITNQLEASTKDKYEKYTKVKEV
ncbi:DeoR/GlpR family DNA-binding transcription regulator [Fundicoccus culcitae]|uniref:DeoR/GlpR family DNA-binding transcription regulator n=1 Tax=Fundicoccus culcitae TaxID=2969821 RepID=A0ABY5P489_9LACT|nr:DeoR/GlpR family DNA-binding transcription regulator [Fundicoccus culcitae]UUX33305.1 DeoR/GlpR family DNA-binding transcription regulator [Fundicoccus culcitae]